MITNVYWFSCKLPVNLVTFQLNLNFLDKFSKKKLKYQVSTQISSIMKISPVGTELFHTNGQTDMTKLIVKR